MSSRSKLGRLSVSAFGPAGDTTPGATRLLFQEFDPGCSKVLLDTGDVTGGHGSLDHGVEHVRHNQTLARPSGKFRPSSGEWRHWLPWIFNHDAAVVGENPPAAGGTTSVYTFVPTDTQLMRNVHYDTDASRRCYLAAGCAVATATIRAESKAAVEMDVQLEGRTFTEAVAFAGNAADYTNFTPRFVMADRTVVLNSVVTNCRSVAITVDNGVVNDRFFYGLTSAGPLQTDRRIGVELTVPFGLHAALWDAGIADAGVPLTVTFAYAGHSMVFTFATVRANAEAFRSPVPQEDFFTFRAMALAKFTATASPAVSCVLTIP